MVSTLCLHHAPLPPPLPSPSAYPSSHFLHPYHYSSAGPFPLSRIHLLLSSHAFTPSSSCLLCPFASRLLWRASSLLLLLSSKTTPPQPTSSTPHRSHRANGTVLNRCLTTATSEHHNERALPFEGDTRTHYVQTHLTPTTSSRGLGTEVASSTSAW